MKILDEHGMSRWWWRKTFWDADHILEVSRGGGECAIENLATRCVGCHARRSALQATARASRKRKIGVRRVSRRPGEYCRGSGDCAGALPCRGCRRYRARVMGS